MQYAVMHIRLVSTKPGMKPAMNNPAMDVFATTP